jgi:hypothetical protein
MSGSSSTSAEPDQATGETPYDGVVSRSPQGSIFAASWWLDAVAPGRWRPHLVEGAAWPTVVRGSRFGDVHVGAPLTPYLGPLLTPGEGVHRRSREIEQLEALLAEIGSCAHVDAACNPAFDYWTPLHWHGFSQTTYYTWRLPALGDTEAVFAGLRENVRREVRKARKQGLVVAEGTLPDYLAVHERTAERQARLDAARANAAVLEGIDAAAGEREARTILVARDEGGRIHAGGYFVHDARWTYYLAGGSDAELRTSGAASLVMWEAIERAAARGTGFDFEGSMLRHVERFFRAFGGVPTPYSIVRWTPSRAFAAVRGVKRAGLAVTRRV